MSVADLDSRLLYTALIALVVAERCVELVISRRNEARLRARGAVETGAGHFPAMVALHTAFLVACLAEVWWLERPWIPALALAMVLLLGLTMALRYWAISTLGGRWATRVLVLPGAGPVTGGPYRWLRHPNYLAVVLEILALPLVHTAWLTAILFSLGNAALLSVRIRAEERALTDAGGYAALAAKPRFVPVAGAGDRVSRRPVSRGPVSGGRVSRDRDAGDRNSEDRVSEDRAGGTRR